MTRSQHWFSFVISCNNTLSGRTWARGSSFGYDNPNLFHPGFSYIVTMKVMASLIVAATYLIPDVMVNWILCITIDSYLLILDERQHQSSKNIPLMHIVCVCCVPKCTLMLSPRLAWAHSNPIYRIGKPIYNTLSLYSISNWISYRKILQILESARYLSDFIKVLVSTAADAGLSNCQRSDNSKSVLRGFKIFRALIQRRLVA